MDQDLEKFIGLDTYSSFSNNRNFQSPLPSCACKRTHIFNSGPNYKCMDCIRKYYDQNKNLIPQSTFGNLPHVKREKVKKNDVTSRKSEFDLSTLKKREEEKKKRDLPHTLKKNKPSPINISNKSSSEKSGPPSAFFNSKRGPVTFDRMEDDEEEEDESHTSSNSNALLIDDDDDEKMKDEPVKFDEEDNNRRFSEPSPRRITPNHFDQYNNNAVIISEKAREFKHIFEKDKKKKVPLLKSFAYYLYASTFTDNIGEIKTYIKYIVNYTHLDLVNGKYFNIGLLTKATIIFRIALEINDGGQMMRAIKSLNDSNMNDSPLHKYSIFGSNMKNLKDVTKKVAEYIMDLIED